MTQLAGKIVVVTGARFRKRTRWIVAVSALLVCWKGVPARMSESSKTQPRVLPKIVKRNGSHVHAGKLSRIRSTPSAPAIGPSTPSPRFVRIIAASSFPGRTSSTNISVDTVDISTRLSTMLARKLSPAARTGVAVSFMA